MTKEFLSKVNLKGNRITELGAPEAAADAATKQYVDDNAGGGHIHEPAYRSYTKSSGTATSAVVNAPAGLQEGDAIVLFIERDNFNPPSTFTLPSGFTQRGATGNYSLNDNADLYVATKMAGASEPSSYTVTFSGGSGLGWKLWCIAFKNGSDSFTDYSVFTYAVDPFTTTDDILLPSLQMQGTKNILVGLIDSGSTWMVPSTPSGMTSIDSASGRAVFYEIVAGAGDTGSRSSTLSNPNTEIGAILLGIQSAVSIPQSSDIIQQDEEPASPEEGDLWLDTDDEGPTGVGLSSIIGYAEKTTIQSGISSYVDLDGLAVTITVPAGRRLRIKGRTRINQSGATNRTAFAIFEGGTELGVSTHVAGTTLIVTPPDVEVIVSPTAGTHTYKLRLSSNAGTVDQWAATTHPAYILVEDITGTLWPAGQSIDSGMLPIVPACRLGLSANQNLPNGSVTTITWLNESYDTDSMHSTSVNTDRITINRAGIYEIKLGGGIQSAADYTRFLARILYNGSIEIARQTEMGTYVAGETNGVVLSTHFNCVPGDFFTAQFLQNNTASGARVLIAAGYTFFSASYIGRSS